MQKNAPAGYVLGIDSGGTHFRVLAGITASHYYLERDELLRRINHHINACLAEFGGARENCRYLVCGTTGLDSQEDGALLNRIYGGLDGFSCPVKVINDAELAHYTVTGGQGVLVISGTGSIAFGRTKNGTTARVGGWLFSILGDEGSGNWMGKMALRHLARWFDGTVPEGPLTRGLLRELGISTRKQLNQIAITIATPPWNVPPLGQLVNRCAAEGDTYARDILHMAAEETFRIVESIASVLKLEETEPDFLLGLWGSNLLKSPIHLEVFREKVLAYNCPTKAPQKAP